MLLRKNSRQAKFLLIAWIVLVTYCFLAFLPTLRPIKTGLDPSWQYAISYAAAKQLVFGKDIIFTYGPLGYLIDGAVLNQNFLAILVFQLLIHFLLLGCIVFKLMSLKNNFQRLLLTISVILAFVIDITAEYKIVFIAIVFLSIKEVQLSKNIRLFSLCLGGVAGFAVLTKFTLGIYTLGSLLVFLTAGLINAIKSKSNQRTCLLAIVDSLVA